MPRIPSARFTALAALATLVLTVCPRSLPAQTATGRGAADVQRQLAARIAQVRGAEVAISVQELGSDRALSVCGDCVFHAASTMKVPVLFALYREFASGTIASDAPLLLVNRFASIVDGSPYALDATEDSDSSVYARVGSEVTLRYLATRMITHSSNLATNALITRLSPERITALTRSLGATRMAVLRGVEDDLAYRAGRNNTTTANDLVALFAALQTGRVTAPAATAEMLGILEAQAFNNELPAGLPPGTRIAHKTGSISATLHDAGIVYPADRPPYAVAVLTRSIPDAKVAEKLIADCSRIIWNWLAAAP